MGQKDLFAIRVAMVAAITTTNWEVIVWTPHLKWIMQQEVVAELVTKTEVNTVVTCEIMVVMMTNSPNQKMMMTLEVEYSP